MELVYPAATRAARVLFRALGLRIDLDGADLVPRSGPVILAANHVSFLDFTLVGLAAAPRHVRFLARSDAFDHWAAGPFLRAMRHVPVDRAAPAGAYLTSRRLLAAGEAVGIFPEAGISQAYDVREVMPGAVALAVETGAPLVPVAIWGPQRVASARRPVDLHRGRPVSISVGSPLTLAQGTDVVSATVDLGARLQAMLDRLQSLPRHRPAPGESPPWHPARLGGSAPTRSEAAPRESSPRSAIRWWERVG
ncbi:lysophospholipid acyltransferase family protein [Nocardioides cynanchi]|uniref:lysophospholipid acyltransferase family protein n=1 Tax=Nocardioides cynanchi TaxID=2558918 RepID=UPI001248EA7B|nr:lysophospholipid acyltransferase family protein [Nocardioides cynanchi]